MAVRRFYGFEPGTFVDVIGSGDAGLTHASVVSTVYRNGRYSLKYSQANYQLNFEVQPQSPTDSSDVGFTGAFFSGGSAWFTGWIRIEQLCDVELQILMAISGDSTISGTQNEDIFRVNLKTDGTLQLQYNTGTAGAPSWNNSGSPSSALSLDTWHRIDFSAEQVKNSQAGTAATELKLNGVQVSRSTGLTINTTNPRTADAMAAFRLMTKATSPTVQPIIYWDDIWIDDAAFADNDGGVTILKPNGAGNYTGWGGAYTSVDDIPQDGTTTQLSVSGVAVSTFALQSCAEGGVGGSIKAVRAFVKVKRTSTPVPNFKVRIRSGSTDLDAASNAINVPTTYTGYGAVLFADVDPATGVAWTTGGVDAMEAGVQQTVVTISSAQWTSLGVEVWSTAPTAMPPLIPRVDSIAPSSGPKAGGTGVTITGENFTGATVVTIGGVDATSVTVVSDTSITCTTAASKPGTYDVIVSSPVGTGYLPLAYTFLPGNGNGNGGNNAGGAGTVVVNMPTSPAAALGDILYAFITVRVTTTTVTQASWGAEIHSRSDGTNSITRVFRKIATGSEPSTYTFTLGTSQKASGVIMLVPGGDFDINTQQITSQANASSANVVAPTLTPTKLGAISIWAGGTATGTTFTPPGSYTEPTGADSASTGGGAGTRTTTAGAYRILTSTSATGSLTGVAGAAATNVGIHIMLDVVDRDWVNDENPLIQLLPQ